MIQYLPQFAVKNHCNQSIYPKFDVKYEIKNNLSVVWLKTKPVENIARDTAHLNYLNWPSPLIWTANQPRLANHCQESKHPIHIIQGGCGVFFLIFLTQVRVRVARRRLHGGWGENEKRTAGCPVSHAPQSQPFA